MRTETETTDSDGMYYTQTQGALIEIPPEGASGGHTRAG